MVCAARVMLRDNTELLNLASGDTPMVQDAEVTSTIAVLRQQSVDQGELALLADADVASFMLSSEYGKEAMALMKELDGLEEKLKKEEEKLKKEDEKLARETGMASIRQMDSQHESLDILSGQTVQDFCDATDVLGPQSQPLADYLRERCNVTSDPDVGV